MPSQTTEFESLLEAVPDAMVGVDEAGVIMFVNRLAESLFGYDRGALIGMPVENLVPESLRMVHTVHRRRYNAAPRTRTMGSNLKLSGLRRDGTEFPADISLSARDGADGLRVIAAVRDMTHYQKAEADRLRLDRLAAIVEFSSDAIVGSTLDGIITSWNPAAEKLFGYTSEEIIGKSVMLVTSEKGAGDSRDILTRIRAGQTVENFVATPIRRDGTPVDVSLNVSPLFDAHGAVVGASGIARDISAQTKAREYEQRMAAIVELSGEAIISSTLDGIITSWNPAAERLFGYSSAEIIGSSGRKLSPGNRTHEVREALARIGEGHAVGSIETQRVRKDGTVFPVTVTISPIHDRDGAIVGASAITRDVTYQRQALESAQRLAEIVEQSNDAFIGRALDGTVTSWNPAAEKMFGYSREEVIGTSAGFTMLEGDESKVDDILAGIKAGQPVLRLETIRVRRDGTRFPVSLSVSPIRDVVGTIVGASAILRDLSAQVGTFESGRSMIEASHDSFVAISPEGTITDANEAMARVTGVPRDKLIGTSFSDYFTEPDKAEAVYQRVVEQEAVTDYPLTLRGHETLTEVLYNASLYRDASGKVLGVFAAARDVTEQTRAAQYARSLIEAALDPMVMISPEGTITDANEATARVTGVPRDKIIGTSFSDYFTDPDKAETVYQTVFEKGAVTDYPLTLRHKDGHETLTEVLYNASLYRDTSGKVLGVFAAARDITKQVEAQKDIAERRARELERLAELERFQRLTVGRELKMIELKKEIEYLRKYGPHHGDEPGDHH